MPKYGRGELYRFASPDNTDNETNQPQAKTPEEIAAKVSSIFADLASGRLQTEPARVSFALNTGSDDPEGNIQQKAHALLRASVDSRSEIDLSDATEANPGDIDDMPQVFRLGKWLVT